MKRRIIITLTLLVGLFAIPLPNHANLPTAAAVISPLRLVYVGDSITVGDASGGWRSILADLFTQIGQPIEVTTVAAGGFSTSDLWPGMPWGLATLRPDLVLINLGTNDGWDVPGFETRLDKMIATTLQIGNAKIGMAFIQYSTPPGLAALEASINDAIYRRMVAHGFIGASAHNTRFAGFADFQNIPASFLDAEGVHPISVVGYEIYAHKIYDSIQASLGLPTIAYAYPPLTGHRP